MGALTVQDFGYSNEKLSTATSQSYEETWDAESCLKSYLATLLHEMIHAFTMTFTCGCNSCEEIFARDYGAKGHGATCHAMATAVEEFVTERLGFDLSLGIATAMEEEWYLTEANLDYVDLRNLDRLHIQRKIDERWLPNGA